MKQQKSRFRWIFSILILLTFLGTENISAQQRRTTTRRTTTRRTTTVKRTTTPKTTVNKPQPSGKFGFYSLPAYAKQAWCDDSGIYYIEDVYAGNAARFISIDTGEFHTIMPSNKGIYEGGHPTISKIFTYNNNIYYLVGNKICKGDINSNSMTDWLINVNDIVDISPNGRYVLIINTALNTELIDIEQGKSIQRWDKYLNKNIVVCNDGSCWTNNTDFNDYTRDIYRINTNGKSTKYPIPFEYYKNNTPYDIEFTLQFAKDGYVYYPYGRRLYRISSTSPENGWEEYLKIPPTINASFSGGTATFIIDSKSNVLFSHNGALYYKATDKDNPIILAEGGFGSFDSDVKSEKGFRNNMTIHPTNNRTNICDKYDNFIFVNDNIISIYNPNGIKGWPNAKNRCCEIGK